MRRRSDDLPFRCSFFSSCPVLVRKEAIRSKISGQASMDHNLIVLARPLRTRARSADGRAVPELSFLQTAGSTEYILHTNQPTYVSPKSNQEGAMAILDTRASDSSDHQQPPPALADVLLVSYTYLPSAACKSGNEPFCWPLPSGHFRSQFGVV